MYFRTETHEYRTKSGRWEERELGTKSWKSVAKNLWQKLYTMRKSVLQNRRPNLAESVRIRMNKRYDEQTKKTSPFAYKYGVDLDNLITK